MLRPLLKGAGVTVWPDGYAQPAIAELGIALAHCVVIGGCEQPWIGDLLEVVCLQALSLRFQHCLGRVSDNAGAGRDLGWIISKGSFRHGGSLALFRIGKPCIALASFAKGCCAGKKEPLCPQT